MSTPDTTDWQIITRLMSDARHNSATDIAEELGLSAKTVRRRITQLEDAGVVRGYTAQINYNNIDDHLVGLYICTVPAPKQRQLAQAACLLPNVTSTRLLLSGQRDLHITATGRTTSDLQFVAQHLSTLGITIEENLFLQAEFQDTYDTSTPELSSSNDDQPTVSSLTDESNLIAMTVSDEDTFVGQTVATLIRDAMSDLQPTVLGIKRNGVVLSADDTTTIEAGDLIIAYTE